MKKLCRAYAIVKYANVAVKDLPLGASGGGIRPGACNMLSEVMPNDLVVATTGHSGGVERVVPLN